MLVKSLLNIKAMACLFD